MRGGAAARVTQIAPPQAFRGCPQSPRMVTLGSTPAARRAGTRHASAAIASNSTDTTTNVAASVALTSNRSVDTRRVSAADASSPIATPSAATPMPSRRHEPIDLARARAESETNADLARAEANRVGHHAVNPDGREDEREQREHAEQRSPEFVSGDGILDQVAHRLHVRDGELGVDAVHDLAHEAANVVGAGLGAHDHREARRETHAVPG